MLPGLAPAYRAHGAWRVCSRRNERVNRMNAVLTRTFNELNLGEIKTCRNLAVVPILEDGEAGPEYMTLAAALKEELLLVSEASQSGSVPEIRVVNKAALPVLILDGEELKGAKQNRASNTTVLVPANSDLILNVSCTERGRWGYTSEQFADSGVVMSHGVRRAKSASVSESFHAQRRACSDQGEVWDMIEQLHASRGTSSPTRAMRDVFETHRASLDECLAAFVPAGGQRGFVFLANGRVMGLDLLSRAPAYREVHERLLSSYVVEMLDGENATGAAPDGSAAHQFIERMLSGEVEAYPSAGLGEDLRVQSAGLCGSALVHENTCIHAALFALDSSNQAMDMGPRMEGFRQRRRRHL